MAEKTPKDFAPLKISILEKLCKTKMSDYEHRVFNTVFRKTFGWSNGNGGRKTEDYISLSQFMKQTGMRESHVSMVRKKLLQRKILTERGKFIGINKQVGEWQDLPKGVSSHTAKNLPKGVSGLTERGKKNLPIGGDTKEKRETLTKENNTKVLVAEPQDKRNPDLQKIIDYAKTKQFSIQGSSEQNRRYAYNLLRKKNDKGEVLGTEKVLWLINAAVFARGKPFYPNINDFKSLFYKWQDLLSKIESDKNSKKKVRNYDE